MNKLGVVNSQDPNAYKCCFCCHVKVGTILYALICLMVQIFFLGLLVLVSIHPDVLLDKNTISGQQFDGIHFINNAFNDKFHSSSRIGKEDLALGFALLMIGILSTVALLYGVIRSRPAYMMPYFCLQVFFFCMTCLSLVSFISYPHLSNQYGMERMISLDDNKLILLLTVFVIVLCIKAYLIAMIWSCYKYVQELVIARNTMREYHVDPDTEMLLPPRYEEAIKPQARNMASPPPPYVQ